MKHKDNYKESKIQEQVIKNLNCMKEIVRLLQESQERINQITSPEWNNIDRIYDKAYTYDKIIETIKLYFPERIKENDNVCDV